MAGRPNANPVDRMLDEYLALDTDQQKSFIRGVETAQKIMAKLMPQLGNPMPDSPRRRGPGKPKAEPPDPTQA